jgi:hypothetical protein
MDFLKETKRSPTLVNPNNFKIPKKVVSSFKENSKRLNIYLGISFVLFLIFFLWNCKYGIFKGTESSPEPFSILYNVGSV